MFFRNLVFLHSSLPFRSFVREDARIRKEQNPCKEWEEVGLQCCFGSVVTLSSEHTQISCEGAFSLVSSLCCLHAFPDTPMTAAYSHSFSSPSLWLYLAAHEAVGLDGTQTLCYSFTSPACLSACLEILITIRCQSEKSCLLTTYTSMLVIFFPLLQWDDNVHHTENAQIL